MPVPPLRVVPAGRSTALSDGLLYLLTGRKSVGEAAELIQGRLAGGLAPAAEENQ